MKASIPVGQAFLPAIGPKGRIRGFGRQECLPHKLQINRLWAVIVVSAFTALSLHAATPADCQKLRYHGQLAEARRCFTGLTVSNDPYIRAEGLWGLEQYTDANNQF